MANRDSDHEPLAEVAEFLAANPATAWVDALCVDLCGAVRGKRYPRSEIETLFRRGMQFPRSTGYLDVTGECLDPQGRGFSDGDPDAACWPVPGTLRPVPWGERPGAQVLMTMREPDGEPCLTEPRNLAAREAARLAELGLNARCAFELEFYLLAAPGRPDSVPRVADPGRLGQVYRLDELEAAEPLLDAVLSASERQGIPASVATSEYAPGQFEINLRHGDDAISAADHCALFRRLVRAVARRHGLRASFMAKPFLNRTGSGMHLHVSLPDAERRNAFDDGGELGTPALRHAIGGLLATMADAMGLLAPNVNSFRRFRPHAFVPVSRSWGYNNRSVAARVPSGAPEARRIEYRVPGADANPYLVLAAVLAGVRHGLEHGLDPGLPAAGNACERVDPELPLEWFRALDRLAGSSFFNQALGAEYVALYCDAKRLEIRKFHDAISAREYEWYL